MHLTEGEKDADNLVKLGLLSCSVAAPVQMDLEFLRDRHVLIHEDNDPPGCRKAKLIAERLDGIAASVRVVRYPDTGDGGDVSDWLAQGHTLEDLLERIEEARATAPSSPEHPHPTR